MKLLKIEPVEKGHLYLVDCQGGCVHETTPSEGFLLTMDEGTPLFLEVSDVVDMHHMIAKKGWVK